jgi:hypothetical protein
LTIFVGSTTRSKVDSSPFRKKANAFRRQTAVTDLAAIPWMAGYASETLRAPAFSPRLLFYFYRSPLDGRLQANLVMLARTSSACRAAVRAHTCASTAACTHTASGAAVDPGVTPPGFIVFPRIPVALFCKFFMPPGGDVLDCLASRVVTPHFTVK